MFSRSAASSTTIPREALMNTDRGFIGANCSAPNRPALPGRPSTCRLTTSDCGQQLVERAAPAGRCRGRAGRRCRRRSPAARAPRRRWTAGCRCCRSRRCRACGRGPRGCPCADLSQTPSCIRWVFSGSRRASAMISPMHQLDDAAGVGVRRVEDRDAALGRRGQVDLVGADAEAADRQQVGCRRRAPSRVIVVLERIPSSATPGSASTSSSSDSEPRPQRRPRSPRVGTPRRRPGGCSPAAAPSSHQFRAGS